MEFLSKITVSYLSGRPTGDIIEVQPYDAYEAAFSSLDGWIAADPENHNRDNWPRKFTKLIVADKTHEELAFLRERSDSTGIARYYFVVPPSDSEQYAQLNQTGRFVANWADYEPYLRSRW